MKKLIITLALALSASFAAQAQAVYSNTVGMVKITIPANSFVFIGIPFDSEGAVGLDDVIGDQLTGGVSLNRGSDQILAWDADNQVYVTFWKDNSTNNWKTSDGDPADLQIEPGSGFWIRSKQGTEQELVVSGNVLESEVTFPTKIGFNQLGFPYPTEMDINDADFAMAAAATGGRSMNRGSDQIMFWDAENGEYVIFWKAEGLSDTSKNGKWLDESSEIAAFIIKPGQGFWFRNKSTDSTWEPKLPYNLSE